jgi:Amt family ammonium transporter
MQTLSFQPASIRRRSAFAIGVAAGIGCYWGATALKHRFRYDDSLDVFGVHGVGGIIGAVLTGVFASEAIGGTAGLIEGNGAQVWVQIQGVAATVAWSAFATWGILKLVDTFVGLRVDEETEVMGLDLALHGETVH